MIRNLNTHQTKARANVSQLAPSGEKYKGEELRRTCLRPGAYDAYDLPSLMDGKQVPHFGGKK